MIPIKINLAKQEFHFFHPIAELEPFAIKDGIVDDIVSVSDLFSENIHSELVSRMNGWVANAQRNVEVYKIDHGFLLKVEGANQFVITSHGEVIGKQNPREQFNQLDRDVILGPALVFALALRNTWSLHASAVMFKDRVMLFMGESGMGKSTLARYISTQNNWRLIADDILPIRVDDESLIALPYFPQLKLPIDLQPALSLPEQLPIHAICILQTVGKSDEPDIKLITPSLAVRDILAHTAGTRMFHPQLLSDHLNASAKIVKHAPVYHLNYPHRKEILQKVKDILENIC